MLRIAHVTDLHVLSHTVVEWRAMLFNKRITGYANTLLRRGRVHRREYLQRVLEAASRAADHLVVTGDITNLALESEYHEARELLDAAARHCETTVVPGNHDIYLPPIHHERRFSHHFGQFLASDLPELALDLPSGPFPSVKLRGPAAIIGLTSAVPRPPFIAAGFLGEAQLKALARVLAHPEVSRRLPVILLHHPPVDDRSRWRQLRDGLVDAAALRSQLSALRRGLVLAGHLHLRVRCTLETDTGTLDVIGASGAALDHDDPSIRAGFNLYEIEDDGSIASIEAHVLDSAGRSFERTAIAWRNTRS
jgi:3',5'-cyclic AMP phosphodiesterase CpdA